MRIQQLQELNYLQDTWGVRTELGPKKVTHATGIDKGHWQAVDSCGCLHVTGRLGHARQELRQCIGLLEELYNWVCLAELYAVSLINGVGTFGLGFRT